MAGKITRSLLAACLAAATLSSPRVMLGQDDRAPMARDQKGPESPAADKENKTTRLTVLVVDEGTKKPIYNAHVVVRFEVDRRLRRDKRISWESKANQRGEVVLSSIPRGTVKVQVIARGYQTYGDQHELDQAEQTVTIAMKTPSGQKSAY